MNVGGDFNLSLGGGRFAPVRFLKLPQ